MTSAHASMQELSPSDWVHGQPTDALKAIVERGAQGGDLFFHATREMDRRAAASLAEAEAARAASQRLTRRQRGLFFLALGAFTLLCILAGLLMQ
jgi:hypothetical protein